MARYLAILCAAALLTVAGCGGGGPATAPRTPVVVDTDMGPDDALALLYLVSRHDLDVRAVAVSGTGLATCPAGAKRALELLAAAGRPDIPVACGRSDPLSGFNAFPPAWRDPLAAIPLPAVARKPDPRGAVRLLDDAIASADRGVVLVALGPLTDVAQLLRSSPAASRRIAAVRAMAGTFAAPGNIGAGHEGAEYNVWIDPSAADAVLRGTVPVTLVGLDATNDVPVTVFFAEALHRYHYATPAAALAWEIVADTGMQTGGRYFWDALAAAAPRAVSLRTERLRATGAGRIVRDGSRPPARIATAADHERFERDLLRTLLGGAPFTLPPTSVDATITCTSTGCGYRGPTESPQAGQAVFDTVNRSGAAMTHVLGRLHEGRTAA
ncbi:MAG TPA: nucleoside hydrolase, partial [Solirubrobacter sp.]